MFNIKETFKKDIEHNFKDLIINYIINILKERT